MPRAPKQCGIQGCATIVPNGKRCPQHTHRWGKGNPRTSGQRHIAWATAVKNRDGRCMIQLPGCTGRPDNADHIIATAFGGAQFDLTNGQAACDPCHAKKSSAEGHQAQGHTITSPLR